MLRDLYKLLGTICIFIFVGAFVLDVYALNNSFEERPIEKYKLFFINKLQLSEEESSTIEEIEMDEVTEYIEEEIVEIIDELYEDGEIYVATREEKLEAVNQKVTILTYHHILKDEENNLYRDNNSVTPYEDFVQQVEYIKNSGYNTITLKQLEDFIYHSKPLPPSKNNNSVLITFDDGYLSNYIHAYPVLKSNNLRAAIFHITELTPEDSINDMNPDKLEYMSIEQMIITKDVFEHELHTHNGHHKVDGIDDYIWMTKDEIVKDVLKNKENMPLSSRARFFAYPFGSYDNETIDALKEAEISLAFTTKRGYTYSTTNPHRINRYGIYRSTNFDEFVKILDR